MPADPEVHMKKQTAYKVATGIAVLAVTPGAIGNIVQPEQLVEVAGLLGVPLALMTLVGIWKVCAIIAMVVPKFPMLTEWAYAGLFFDLTGAAFLHAAVADYGGIAPPLVVLALVAASYVTRARVLADPA